MSLVDILLVVAAIAAGFAGYRQGFLTGALGFVGFIIGAIVGILFVPNLVEGWDSALAQAVVAILGVLLLAAAGQAGLAVIGSTLRSRFTWEPARVADAAGGSILSVISVLLVAWFIGLAVVAGPPSELSREVRSSTILGEVDRVVPDQARGLFSALRESLNRSVFPDVFAGIMTPEIVPVQPPDPALEGSAVARRVESSIVRVGGDAPQCRRLLSGSGFVYAPEHVLTNAHVVAGTDEVAVQIGGRGAGYSARVVLFDPAADVAVLYVPGLPSAPLTFAPKPASRGDDALVIGFPGGGSYDVNPARVRDVQKARGLDIYSKDSVVREIYALRAEVRPGNSGGPLIDPTGLVLGMVFAASVEDPESGYALTANEIAPDAQASAKSQVPVATGVCD